MLNNFNILTNCNLLKNKYFLVLCFYLKKNNNNSFECDILKNDIYFAALRAFSILASKPLNGFKKLEEKVNRLPLEYQELINNIFSSNNIEKTIDIISRKINSLNNSSFSAFTFAI